MLGRELEPSRLLEALRVFVESLLNGRGCALPGVQALAVPVPTHDPCGDLDPPTSLSKL